MEDDNIIIENIEFTEELYNKAIQNNQFNEDTEHGIGDDTNGDS